MDTNKLIQEILTSMDMHDIEPEDVKKASYASTDSFIAQKFILGQDVPDEEFTEDFAQSQIKAFNFLNIAHRKRMEDAFESKPKTGNDVMDMMSKTEIPLLCMTIVSQIEALQNVIDRAENKGYDIVAFSMFTDDELDDIEEERIHKLHGWEQDNE